MRRKSIDFLLRCLDVLRLNHLKISLDFSETIWYNIITEREQSSQAKKGILEKMRIYFDMDGTLANLYSIDNWVDRLESYDSSVYEEADPLFDFRQFARILNKLQDKGVYIGIISWNSKCGDDKYHEAVKMAKKRWLARHLPSVVWDEIHIIKYGAPKHFNCQDNSGILFDDNEEVRKLWNKRGMSFSEKDVIEVLLRLL